MFKSKAEFAQAMLEGRKFIDATGGICFFDKEIRPSPFAYQSAFNNADPQPLAGCWDEYETVTEDCWYNEIPEEGILCWVWGGFYQKYEKCAKVTEYASYKNHKFICTDGLWTNAEPMTDAEILERLNVRS